MYYLYFRLFPVGTETWSVRLVFNFRSSFVGFEVCSWRDDIHWDCCHCFREDDQLWSKPSGTVALLVKMLNIRGCLSIFMVEKIKEKIKWKYISKSSANSFIFSDIGFVISKEYYLGLAKYMCSKLWLDEPCGILHIFLLATGLATHKVLCLITGRYTRVYKRFRVILYEII